MVPRCFITPNKKVIKKIKRYLPKSEALSISLIDLRSCNNKDAPMKQFIDEVCKTALKPDGYKILSSPYSPILGGGIAIISKENLQITKTHKYQFETCECTDFKISFDQVFLHIGTYFTDQKTTHPYHL